MNALRTLRPHRLGRRQRLERWSRPDTTAPTDLVLRPFIHSQHGLIR